MVEICHKTGECTSKKKRPLMTHSEDTCGIISLGVRGCLPGEVGVDIQLASTNLARGAPNPCCFRVDV